VSSKLLIGIAFSSILVGCAGVPLKSADQGDKQADCPDCGAKPPYYATAVTRPALCNDYPVEYRVQVPETDPRIRPIERVVMGEGSVKSDAKSCAKRSWWPW